MKRAADEVPLFSFLKVLTHQVAVHRCELPPETILEFIQFAVKREMLGLWWEFGNTVARDALDVIGG